MNKQYKLQLYINWVRDIPNDGLIKFSEREGDIKAGEGAPRIKAEEEQEIQG